MRPTNEKRPYYFLFVSLKAATLKGKRKWPFENAKELLALNKAAFAPAKDGFAFAAADLESRLVSHDSL